MVGNAALERVNFMHDDCISPSGIIGIGKQDGFGEPHGQSIIAPWSSIQNKKIFLNLINSELKILTCTN